MHPYKILITCCGTAEQIDADLAPACTAIWAHGIHTQSCCQGDGDGNAVIAFPDIGEADRFGQLVFDFDRMNQLRLDGQLPPEMADRVPAAEWKIWTHFRFPLPQRAIMAVNIPRADLPWLTQWLDGAPARPLETPPVADPSPVDPDAGKELTEDQKNRYDQLMRAAEVLDALDDGKCSCEPSDDGEGSDHDGDCPRGYDHLATAADIAAFQRVIDHWETNGGGPYHREVIDGMRAGVTARAIELGCFAPP